MTQRQVTATATGHHGLHLGLPPAFGFRQPGETERWANEMTTGTDQEFVSESITPLVATADTGAMAAGGPGLPLEFRWRGPALRIAAVVRTWRETGVCKHGSGEAYVRKHWFEVETTTGRKAVLYFERQPRGRNKTARWWLYSIDKEKRETQPAVRTEFPSEHPDRDP